MLRQPLASGASTRPRTRRVSWRQEYLHVALVALTVCWLAPWVALSLNWLVDIPLSRVLGLTALHLLGSAFVTRWLLRRRVAPGRIFAAVIVLAWLAAALSVALLPSMAHPSGGTERLAWSSLFRLDNATRVPAGPVLIVWVLYLWWRGYNLGAAYITVVRAAFNMRLGLLAFLVVMLVGGSGLRTEILALVPPFFFFGLLASSLARADSLGLDRAGHGTPLGRRWIASLVALALGVSTGGYLLAVWASGLNTARAARSLATVVEGALTLLFILASPVLFVAQAIYDFLDKILPDQMPAQTIEPGGTTTSTGAGGTGTTIFAQVFNAVDDILLIAIFIILAISVFALIWFLVLMRADPAESSDEEREAVGTAEVVGGLRQALRDGWRRVTGALAALRQFGVGRNLLTALTIRRIYAQMERLAARRGYPRATSETPYEYRAALRQAFPDKDDDVSRITEAYVAVRYGDIPEEPGALEAVRSAWERLRAAREPEQPIET